jgi:hypothetical protein
MTLARAFGILMLFALFCTPLYAQDAQEVVNEDFGITVVPPAKWENTTQGNDKAVANFKHKGSQSQIEVVGTKLMTADVAEVFFNTFHQTLKDSSFVQDKQETKKYDSTGEGRRTTYTFTHSGVTLEVVVFEFTKGNTAWLVVGYMQEVDKDKYIGDYEKVLENLKFKG